MTIIDSILNYLTKGSKQTSAKAPEGFCPNCWGYQEYGGNLVEAYEVQNAKYGASSPNHGWIQEYADKNLSGIKLLAKDGILICHTCKTEDDTKA